MKSADGHPALINDHSTLIKLSLELHYAALQRVFFEWLSVSVFKMRCTERGTVTKTFMFSSLFAYLRDLFSSGCSYMLLTRSRLQHVLCKAQPSPSAKVDSAKKPKILMSGIVPLRCPPAVHEQWWACPGSACPRRCHLPGGRLTAARGELLGWRSYHRPHDKTTWGAIGERKGKIFS